MAARATAELDVRLPVGVQTADVVDAAHTAVRDLPGVTLEVLRRFEPTFTDPRHEIVRLIAKNAMQALGTTPAVTMRVGTSDSRYYRERGIPTVVYGPTPGNMGGPSRNLMARTAVEPVYRAPSRRNSYSWRDAASERAG